MRRRLVRTLIAGVLAVATLGLSAAAAPGAGAGGPSNGDIVFQRCERFPGGCSIYSVNPDGTGAKLLTDNDPDIAYYDPVVSPNGAKILATTFAPITAVPSIWALDADGTDPQVLATGGKWPDWSPDGTKIVYQDGGASGSGDIIAMDADGTDKVNLTPGAQVVGTTPTWSPDGGTIAFVGSTGESLPGGATRTGLVIMGSNGSSPHIVVDANMPVNVDKWSVGFPDFTPSGAIIFTGVFWDGIDGGWNTCACGGADLFRTDTAGTTPVDLTNTANRGEYMPAVSPDGTRIAVEADTLDDEPHQIWTVGIGGGGAARVLAPLDTGSFRGDQTPSWASVQIAPAFPLASHPTEVAVSMGGSKVPVPGDFDADGDTDVFWYVPGAGAESVWQSDGDGTFTVRTAPSISATGLRPFPGDFNGDGKDDLFLYGPGAAADQVWRVNGLGGGGLSRTVSSTSIGGNFTPVPGDFDGDDDTDVFWYGPGTVADKLWRANATPINSFTSFAKGRGGHFTPRAADLDGDGDDDIVWYKPSPSGQTSKSWEFTGGAGFATASHSLDSLGPSDGYRQLLAGDFKADGHGDVYGQSEGGGFDNLLEGITTSELRNQRTFDQAGTFDRSFPGDFDGNGASDIAWYKTGSGADEIWLFPNPGP